MISQIRTAILASIAVLCIGATVVPVAEASKNNGGYQNSSAGQQVSKKKCESLKTDVQFWESVANYLDDAPGKDGERAFMGAVKESERAYQKFKKAGCTW